MHAPQSFQTVNNIAYRDHVSAVLSFDARWRQKNDENLQRTCMQTVTPHRLLLLSSTEVNESVPIQLAQCRFHGVAIFNAKISIYFSK